MKHTATIKNGKIEFDNPNLFAIEKSKLEGEKVVLSLEKQRKNRSLNQNSYLFGQIMPLLCENVGVQQGESHELWEAVKIKVGFYKKTPLGIIAKQSRNLTTIEFEKLMSAVRTWASVELKCYLPLPNEEIF